MIGEYLTLDRRRLEKWEEFTRRQNESAVVRVWRDYAREVAAVHAARAPRVAALRRPRLVVVGK